MKLDEFAKLPSEQRSVLRAHPRLGGVKRFPRMDSNRNFLVGKAARRCSGGAFGKVKFNTL